MRSSPSLPVRRRSKPALNTIEPLAQTDADDWQAAALLTRACAESGDTSCRDSGIARMMDLHHRGITPPSMHQYVVERVQANGNILIIRISLEPWGYFKVLRQAKSWTAKARSFSEQRLKAVMPTNACSLNNIRQRQQRDFRASRWTAIGTPKPTARDSARRLITPTSICGPATVCNSPRRVPPDCNRRSHPPQQYYKSSRVNKLVLRVARTVISLRAGWQGDQ